MPLLPRVPREYWYRSPSSLPALFVVRVALADFAQPVINFLASSEVREHTDIPVKGISTFPPGPNHRLVAVRDELHPISRPQTEARTDLLRDRDLTFTADAAGSPHLYFLFQK